MHSVFSGESRVMCFIIWSVRSRVIKTGHYGQEDMETGHIRSLKWSVKIKGHLITVSRGQWRLRV